MSIISFTDRANWRELSVDLQDEKKCEEISINLVAKQNVTVATNYAIHLSSPVNLERAIRILYAGKDHLNQEDIYCHLISVTDFVVCAYLNGCLYQIYESPVIQRRKLAYRFKQLSDLWSHFFHASREDKKLILRSFRLLKTWANMLRFTDENKIFVRCVKRQILFMRILKDIRRKARERSQS